MLNITLRSVLNGERGGGGGVLVIQRGRERHKDLSALGFGDGQDSNSSNLKTGGLEKNGWKQSLDQYTASVKFAA
jgi:hypothetical protein